MKCENCEQEHNGSYGSGRFCNAKCARGFSTKSKRDEINRKVSSTLSGREKTEEERQKLKDAWDVRRTNGTHKWKRLSNEEFFVVGSKNNNQKVKNRLFEENIKKYECEECGISNYRDKPITLQLHHVNGVNTDNRIENLQILCPNCHSQTDNYAGKGR